MLQFLSQIYICLDCCMICEVPMEIHQLRDEVYTSNVYLINCDKPTLVDTGGSVSEQIKSWVTEILRFKSLHQIIFTHGHPDHVQGANMLADHFSVPLYIHPADSEHIENSMPLGSYIDCGDVSFKVIHTPGHSPGGVCFYEPNQKILISGDTIFPGGRTGRWDLPGSNYEDLVRSVKKLMNLEIEMLYPGHYDPISSKIQAHLEGSLGTLEFAGESFDEEKYDQRIEALKEQLGP